MTSQEWLSAFPRTDALPLPEASFPPQAPASALQSRLLLEGDKAGLPVP